MGLVEALCLLIVLGKSFGQEQTYIISAPKVFHVGASENVFIHVYGYTEAFNATISVKSYPDKKFQYSSDHVSLCPDNKFQNSAIVKIPSQKLLQGQNPASYVYLDVVSRHFSESKKVPITYNNGVLFIHTDKFVYTPGQSVKVKVYSLNGDVKPTERETVLTFIDPEGSKVEVKEENVDSGIISFPDFKIPSNPKFGVWTIQAKYKDGVSMTGTTYFEIKEYDESFKEILRTRRTLKSAIEKEAAKYKHRVLKKCCYDGAFRNDYETCESRAKRVTIGPKCVKIFSDCCIIASQIQHKSSILSTSFDS